MSKLVIVESPTKARTIRNYLPEDYRVEASMGHIRDLPGSAQEVPPEYKSKDWASLGVNVDNDFELEDLLQLIIPFQQTSWGLFFSKVKEIMYILLSGLKYVLFLVHEQDLGQYCDNFLALWL